MRAVFGALVLLLSACAPAADAPAPSLTPAQQRQLADELEQIDACGYVGCRGPFHIASELDIGEFPMGMAVPDLPRNASCNHADLQNYGPARMCGFTRDGVIYVAVDGRIISKSINVDEPPRAGLPFGLEGGQTMEQALATMREHTEAPLGVNTFPGGGGHYISNDDILKNAHDRPFLFSLLFVNDRLMSILLQDPSAPTD
ncbi:MAG: hypothetical protein ABL889_18580 [Terricaulis sp.]